MARPADRRNRHPIPGILLVAVLVASPALALQSDPPQDPEVVAAALSLIERGDRPLALARLRELAEDAGRPPDVRGVALFRLGELLLEEGRLEAAVDSLEAAARFLPEDAGVHHALGDALVARIDDVWLLGKVGVARRAGAAFRRAVELDPDWLEARISLLGFYLQAPRMVGGGVEKATEQAAAIAEIDRARGHYARAAIWDKKERYDLEATELRGAIQLEPDNLEYRHALGRLYQRLERWDEAHEVFEEALRVAPGHGPSLYRLGVGAAASGERLTRGAQALAEYLAQEHPDPALVPWVHYRLGMIHRHRGDRQAARQAFTEALRLDPEMEQARDALAELEAPS